MKYEKDFGEHRSPVLLRLATAQTQELKPDGFACAAHVIRNGSESGASATEHNSGEDCDDVCGNDDDNDDDDVDDGGRGCCCRRR